jgi:D-Tyr-tRNAtyr deacylase
MARILTRRLSVGTVVVAIAAVAASSAFAASSNRGPRFGPAFGLGRLGGGPGFGGPGFFGGGPGHLRIGPGGGLLAADVLTPAASYLGISVADLASDLKSGKTLAQEATAKGKTASGLIDALVTAEKKVLDAENAAGWLTDAQETNVLANLKDAITDLVDNGPGLPPSGPRNGLLQTAATYLGISAGDLLADLRSGKTLAQEATDKGKTADGLVQALLAPLRSALDQRVKDGDITSAQETGILNRETTRLTDLVNNTKPAATRAGLRVAGLRIMLQRLFLSHR